MIFNSVTYLLFLALSVALYWLLPRRPRLWMIFLGSLSFYGFWRVEFLPLMMTSALIDYVAALAISRSSRAGTRRALLLLSLFGNLGLLFYFKYLMFFADNVSGLARLAGIDFAFPALNIILPLGISFYTFQTISYTVDVYRGFIEPERDFVLYGCFVVFFPQLVAGPVLRAAEVLHQLTRRPEFRLGDMANGLRRVAYGLFLKVVLADNIAPLVDTGFAMKTADLSALDVWTLTFLFGFQIYFDFSAYSHIALGSARMMGIHFPENFDFPYLASSPRDFWRRWHISLSSWIRDYLYLPLAGTQVHDRSTGGLAGAAADPAGGRKTRALFLTWAIMGLWHGAAWTFVAWGLYHALLIYGHRTIGGRLRAVPPWLARWGGLAITMPLAMLSWVPFRAQSLTQTREMFLRIGSPSGYGWFGLREDTYLIAALVLVAMLLTYLVQTELAPRLRRFRAPWFLLEGASFAVIVALVFIFLRPIRQFIYFQF